MHRQFLPPEQSRGSGVGGANSGSMFLEATLAEEKATDEALTDWLIAGLLSSTLMQVSAADRRGSLPGSS